MSIIKGIHACGHSIHQAEREGEAQLGLDDPLNVYLQKNKTTKQKHYP